jgi:hypothetical protein
MGRAAEGPQQQRELLVAISSGPFRAISKLPRLQLSVELHTGHAKSRGLP